tara:strand:+ start:34 stop:342 length:309 start_codon:yes stop_codon:yes gene_type:complete
MNKTMNKTPKQIDKANMRSKIFWMTDYCEDHGLDMRCDDNWQRAAEAYERHIKVAPIVGQIENQSAPIVAPCHKCGEQNLDPSIEELCLTCDSEPTFEEEGQ